MTYIKFNFNPGPCVEAACRTAYELIDLRNHTGGHPRLGAVDLVPFHPISKDTCIKELGEIALGEYI